MHMTIHTAHDPILKVQALNLVASRYCDLGYDVGQLAPGYGETIMVAMIRDELAATITLRHERMGTLACKTTFPYEIEELRQTLNATAPSLIEVGRFATSTRLTPAALGELFLTSARTFARDGVDMDLIIEVNPKHRRFYERALGFKAISKTRHCPRVNAPAVLMHLHVDSMPHTQNTRLLRQQTTRPDMDSLAPSFH